MKQVILMLSILSLLLWGCPEQSEKAAKSPGETIKGAAVETTQADTLLGADAAKEKAKEVIKELQETPQGSKEDTN